MELFFSNLASFMGLVGRRGLVVISGEGRECRVRAEARSCLEEAEGSVGGWQVRYWDNARPREWSGLLLLLARVRVVLWDREMASSGWRKLACVFLVIVIRVWICFATRED